MILVYPVYPCQFIVTLRNITIKQADRTFILKNVEGLKLENVVIGGQRVDGRLEWRQAAAQP